MFAKLTALVSGTSSTPFTIDKTLENKQGIWEHHHGKLREDNSIVSIFKLSNVHPMDATLAAARHAIKSLKTMRHPNVLIYKDMLEVEEKERITLYLVTEPVEPLEKVLLKLNLLDKDRNEYLAMGLHQISSAIAFLNHNCHMIHGQVSMASVVVTQTLDWKLFGFELLTDHQTFCNNNSPLQSHCHIFSDIYKCSEFGNKDWQKISEHPAWSIDSWGLGCLIQEVFNNKKMTSIENLRDISNIPENLLKDYQRLLNSNPNKRLDPVRFSKSHFLNNNLLYIVNFLENLAVKDGIDKDMFFKKMPNLLKEVPKAVSEQKILPLLSKAVEFDGAPAAALSCILQIGQNMSEESYKDKILPPLSAMFSSTDRNIRRYLLENIEKFGCHISEKTMESDIYPQLQTGFTDTNGYIRELTLKSMRTIVDKLSQKTLNQSLLKYLAKLQVDIEPSIRANTTVLLGNIADLLGEASCKKVLLNAFSRALKDVFAPAKIAGIKAFMTTQKYYSVQEVAVKVIPSISPLTIDNDKDVREGALQCILLFTDVLQKNSNELKENEEDITDKNISINQRHYSHSQQSNNISINNNDHNELQCENNDDLFNKEEEEEEEDSIIKNEETKVEDGWDNDDFFNLDEDDEDDEGSREDEAIIEDYLSSMLKKKDSVKNGQHQQSETIISQNTDNKSHHQLHSRVKNSAKKPMKLGAKKL